MAPRLKPAAEAAAPAAALSVYAELMAAARSVDASFADPHAKEPLQTFLKRLIRAIGDLPDDTWNGLSEAHAQEWYNGNAQRMKAGEELLAPEGLDISNAPPAKGAKEPKAAGAAEGEILGADGKPLTGLALYNAKRKLEKEAQAAGGAAPAPAASAKPAPAAKEPKAPKAPREPKAAAAPRAARAPGQGLTFQVRKAIIANPSATVAELSGILEAQGVDKSKIKASTISTLRGDIAATMMALRELGKLA